VRGNHSNSMINYRLAQADDASSIFSILEEVANEIPLNLDSHHEKDRKKLVSDKVEKWCRANESWVGVTQSHQVVGFLLVEPDEMERIQHENSALHISYAGVTKNYRRQGILPELVRNLMAKKVHLTAVVNHANKSNMSCRLIKLGFTKVASRPCEDAFQWYPPV
jgi:ribosomal protein S18 acetylase RimI-like enzyme